jgi:hypothetical protein
MAMLDASGIADPFTDRGGAPEPRASGLARPFQAP